MKIHVRPRYWVERKIEVLPEFLRRCALISIYSSGDCPPILTDVSTILKLQFDDITKREENLILFTDEMADQIIHFADFLIEKFQTRELVVHCDAGVSRSGAVGSVLNDYINTKLGMEEDKKDVLERASEPDYSERVGQSKVDEGVENGGGKVK